MAVLQSSFLGEGGLSVLLSFVDVGVRLTHLHKGGMQWCAGVWYPRVE